MASTTASRPPAPAPPPPAPPPPPPLQWLGPRVSFSLDDAGGRGGGGGGAAAGGGEVAAGGKPGGDFEFLLAAGCSAVSMLPADELFSGGKLVPLRVAGAEDGSGAVPAPLHTEQAPETPRADEPKVPARRWRDLLRRRKQQQQQQQALSEPRPLRRLLRCGPKSPDPEPSLILPLLRESGGPDEKASPAAAANAAAAAASAPPRVPSPTPPPPSQHQSLLPPKIRTPPTPPPPVAADSPRLNAAGKVVFCRSSSSPSSLAVVHRGGAMERSYSYSAHVRVAPVLNVPVCSLRKSVSVLGIDRLFSSSSPPSSSSAVANRNTAGRKARAAKKEATDRRCSVNQTDVSTPLTK